MSYDNVCCAFHHFLHKALLRPNSHPSRHRKHPSDQHTRKQHAKFVPLLTGWVLERLPMLIYIMSPEHHTPRCRCLSAQRCRGQEVSGRCGDNSSFMESVNIHYRTVRAPCPKTSCYYPRRVSGRCMVTVCTVQGSGEDVLSWFLVVVAVEVNARCKKYWA